MRASAKGNPDEVATVARPRVERPSLDVARYALVVLEGPDRGRTLEFAGDHACPILVGTSPACDLRLVDPLVSRRHFALEASEGWLSIRDAESTNGTLVDGVSIVEARLRGGERVTLGETTVRLDLVAQTTSVPLVPATQFGRIVGASTEMRRLYRLCERLSASSVPLILEGETGTGKELLAESIHEMGPRATKPFVVFDCTAVAPSLMEAALFGHERGAFTGAVDTRKGVFEEAHGGTLLIDEIGELDLQLQSKLLRAIEKSEVRRVGGDRWIKVDVRVLAATRRDLDHEVAAERFRDDLFFRLAVARIELPPLRRRKGDIAVLAQHFWKLHDGKGELSPAVLRRFEDYAWPGNVRELQNAVSRKIAFGDLDSEEQVGLASRSPRVGAGGDAKPRDPIDAVIAEKLPLTRAREKVVDDFERRYVADALASQGGNVARAAAAAGVALRYFQLLRAKQR